MNGVAAFGYAEFAASRLSVPRRGHVLSTVSELYGRPIRNSVQLLASGLVNSTAQLPEVCFESPAATSELVIQRSSAELAAWHTCARWVVGVALGSLTDGSDLTDALTWFDERSALLPAVHSLGSDLLSKVLQQLRVVANPAALADLLPYILDPHGPGSRLSVMRDPSTKSARAARRVHGVFYTPSDVAEYMAQCALAEIDIRRGVLRAFDPACGTGVFLRAILRLVASQGADPLRIVQQCLFGMDIDPWAVDGAAYVLLHDTLSINPREVEEPALLWSSIRRNLAIGDALTIDPSNTVVRPTLFNLPAQPTRFRIDQVFPSMGGAPNVIIGNPPYAAVNARADFRELSTVFTTFPAGASIAADMHPLFFEQMIRLAALDASGALVLPLSIAFSGGQQYQAARELIDQTSGTWRFSFFDREPHALFGEDVKTRNSIITWRRTLNDQESRKMTGPLLKWRGHDRARMLRGIRHTEIHGSVTNGIPKLNSRLQADILTHLIASRSNLSSLVGSFYSTRLEDTFVADRRTIFVGGTAYNFLNVFFRPPLRLRPQSSLISTNTIHGLRCLNRNDALAAFALLSSGIAFWLWHTLGDGFHVSRGFLESLPLGPTLFNGPSYQQLSSAGNELWRDLQSCSVSSLNGGRASLSFPASRLRQQQRTIDQIIIRSLGLSDSFLGELDRFINSVISATPQGETNPNELKEELVG